VVVLTCNYSRLYAIRFKSRVNEAIWHRPTIIASWKDNYLELCHKILMTSGLIRCGLITSFLSSFFLPRDKRVKPTDTDGCPQTRGFEGRKDSNVKTFCIPVCSVLVTPLHKLTVFRNMGPSTVADGRRLEYDKMVDGRLGSRLRGYHPVAPRLLTHFGPVFFSSILITNH
jgi:hypothetical protein